MSSNKSKVLAELEHRRRTRTLDDWLNAVSPHHTWDIPHLVYMRKYLERIVAGERLYIVFLAPPRHGKSEQNTVHFAPYYLYKNPQKRVIVGAYNQSLANYFSLLSRKIYARCAPHLLDKKSVLEWSTTAGGVLKPAGMDSGVTGRGGDLIIIDDPIKNRSMAYSKVYREKIWNGFKTDFYTRREPGASFLLTLTHWHHDDLVGRLLNSPGANKWIVVKLPALAGEKDILGRQPGEALWPARYDAIELLETKELLGDDFSAMYQQDAVIAKGNIFKRNWFVIQDPKEFPVKFDYIGQYWDTAEKTGQHNDYSVCVTLAKYLGKRYVLNVNRKRMEFPELKESVINQSTYYRPMFIGIEDKSSGTQVLQELGRSVDLIIKPEAINPIGDKESRARATTPMIKNGDIILPVGAEWLEDFIDELCLFPQAPHDDQVDAFVMGLNHQRDVGYNLQTLIGK